MNKKTAVIAISIISVLLFAALVYHGLRYSRGVPVPVEKVEKAVLEAPFMDIDLDLARGISLNRWDGLTSKEIELMYQVTILPWGRSLVSPIRVKAFHNKKDIYFCITWNDDTENREVKSNIFSDACAIMFPRDDKAQPSTLMMGFLGSANIWHWKASYDKEFWLKVQPETEAYADFHYPFEEEELFTVSREEVVSAVRDLTAIRVGTITPKERQDVEGRGFWKDGAWHVVFKRSLKAVDPEIDAVFNLGTKRLCAFAVWNGGQGDRGARKSISDWVELEIK